MEGVLGSRSSHLAKGWGDHETLGCQVGRKCNDRYIPENEYGGPQNDGPKGKGGLRLKIWSFFGIYVRFLGCMIFF